MSLQHAHRNFQLHLNSLNAVRTITDSDKVFEIPHQRHHLENDETFIVKAIDFHMPLLLGNIHLLNNTFDINVDPAGGNDDTYTIVIPVGQYSLLETASALETQLNIEASQGETWTVTENSTQNTLSFSCDNFEFNILLDQNGDIDINKELGFDPTDTIINSTGQEIDSTYPCDLSGIKRVYIHAPDFSMFSVDVRDNSSHSILASIPNLVSGHGILTYFNNQNTNNLLFTKRISQLRIRLTDEENRSLDDLGLPPNISWTMTIQFDILKFHKDEFDRSLPRLILGQGIPK